MTQHIETKVVVITGASSGLGSETARHLTAAGAKVVLGPRVDRLEARADEIGLCRDEVVSCDVTDRAQPDDIDVSEILSRSTKQEL